MKQEYSCVELEDAVRDAVWEDADFILNSASLKDVRDSMLASLVKEGFPDSPEIRQLLRKEIIERLETFDREHDIVFACDSLKAELREKGYCVDIDAHLDHWFGMDFYHSEIIECLKHDSVKRLSEKIADGDLFDDCRYGNFVGFSAGDIEKALIRHLGPNNFYIVHTLHSSPETTSDFTSATLYTDIKDARDAFVKELDWLSRNSAYPDISEHRQQAIQDGFIDTFEIDFNDGIGASIRLIQLKPGDSSIL